MIILFVLFFLGELAGAEALSHRFQIKQDEQFKFLKLQDAFYDCPSRKVLDGTGMGIVSFEGAVQNCVANPDCKYFAFNKETSQIYVCADNKGFTTASPNMSWIMGVKPATLETPSFKITPNTQAICEDVVLQKSASSIEDAIRTANEVQVDFFTINLNQGSAVGPGIASKTAFFCRGRKKTFARNGFLLIERTNEAGVPPRPPKTVEAPCGLNGSIQPDSSKMEEDILPGQIVEASWTTT